MDHEPDKAAQENAMNHDEIRSRIVQNLTGADVPADEVRVQPDPYGGWRIAVVSSGFDTKGMTERNQIAMNGLGDLTVEWLDLLTPEEKESSGALPLDGDLENLPLWPESLARGATATKPRVYPSDLDEDLDPPIVVSFYSLRGGVGRSTALAYTGRILAAKGRKVVCVDMDLEAPGLAALFDCEGQVRHQTGVAQLLVQLDAGGECDLADHLIRVTPEHDLYCLPAGVPDANHARLLRLIDPAAWYREERNPLRELLQQLRTGLPFRPDVILLDARTGITPLSAPLLFDLADVSVIVLFPHPQARAGTGALVRALLAAESWRPQSNGQVLTPEPRFLISPIPPSRAREIVERYQHRALEWIAEWLAPLNESPAEGQVAESDITHFVPYRESLATSDCISGDREQWRDFEPVAEWVERFLPTQTEQRTKLPLKDAKPEVLAELRFATGTAEQQDDLPATFVETDTVRRAMAPEIALVLGRKGTGKTAVFRHLAENAGEGCVVAQSPGELRGERQWVLGPEGFRGIENVLGQTSAEWRQFWTFYTCVAASQDQTERDVRPELAEVVQAPIKSELDVVQTFGRVSQLPSHGLLLNDWLARLDQNIDSGILLLYDGLDTGFGSTTGDRQRRLDAIAGLFDFWIDRGAGLRNLRLKIFLREDIWRKVQFENKSHLFGRSVMLHWQDQATFLKVALKQARNSQLFRGLVTTASQGRVGPETEIENWSEDEAFEAWGLLVGERMKGGKTTFTRNWVWKRLADGKDDHSPRYLLQLLHSVVEWEKLEHKRSPYDGSIVRPRAMEVCLPKVSQEALGALAEEFGELEPLLKHLRQIGSTPFQAREVRDLEDLVMLAREVGVLSVYEGTEDRVERYTVPEIYRHALNLGRRGQV